MLRLIPSRSGYQGRILDANEEDAIAKYFGIGGHPSQLDEEIALNICFEAHLKFTIQCECNAPKSPRIKVCLLEELYYVQAMPNRSEHNSKCLLRELRGVGNLSGIRRANRQRPRQLPDLLLNPIGSSPNKPNKRKRKGGRSQKALRKEYALQSILYDHFLLPSGLNVICGDYPDNPMELIFDAISETGHPAGYPLADLTFTGNRAWRQAGPVLRNKNLVWHNQIPHGFFFAVVTHHMDGEFTCFDGTKFKCTHHSPSNIGKSFFPALVLGIISQTKDSKHVQGNLLLDAHFQPIFETNVWVCTDSNYERETIRQFLIVDAWYGFELERQGMNRSHLYIKKPLDVIEVPTEGDPNAVWPDFEVSFDAEGSGMFIVETMGFDPESDGRGRQYQERKSERVHPRMAEIAPVLMHDMYKLRAGQAGGFERDHDENLRFRGIVREHIFKLLRMNIRR